MRFIGNHRGTIMSILASIRSQIVPVNSEGYPFIAGLGLASLILMWIWSPLGWLAVLATLWCVYFFRDPKRVTPLRDGLVIAPADGRVLRVVNAVPPPELALGERALPRISIFMSVFDCHVNRSPVSGRVERMAYRPGVFLNADLDKASEDNERNCLVITTRDGTKIGVVQIAGLVARRIVPFVKQGANVGAGQRIGMIRFGSRLDIYLPDRIRPLASEGQTAIAGETIIADLRDDDPERSFRVG